MRNPYKRNLHSITARPIKPSSERGGDKCSTGLSEDA